MDKLDRYRQLIQELLAERAKMRSANDPIKSQTIFDRQSDRYQLVNVGWKNSSTRIYGCALHVDIIDGKIWVQHDGTEDAIADRLVAEGVPK
nr:XisI protein [Lusitaniella coriacea]